MFQTKSVEKIKTHILYSEKFFGNSVVYEITWTNVVEPNRPQIISWSMHIECWITKATNTHSEYVIGFLIAFPLPKWFHKHPTPYKYIQCLSYWTLILINIRHLYSM